MNKVVVAVAGAGKTRRIAEEIAESSQQERILVLTYTRRNQAEDANRIALASAGSAGSPRIMGWMSFLLNEVIRPYLPAKYPHVKLRSLGIDPESSMYLKGSKRYFSEKGDAYPGVLSKLAFDVIKAAKGAPIKRLELLYDAIYIDEAQDLRGNDLEIITMIFKSAIATTVVLDPRQSVLATSKRDTKNKKYRGVKALEFYREQQSRGLCTMETLNRTYRFIPEIARFSDLVFDERFDFPETESRVICKEKHQGIFAISKMQIMAYASEYGATILRWNEKSGIFPGLHVANFGECKGMQCDHIVIVSTKSISDFLLKGKSLSEETTCKFYVAITRARYSVAIVFDDPAAAITRMAHEDSVFNGIELKEWSPEFCDESLFYS